MVPAAKSCMLGRSGVTALNHCFLDAAAGNIAEAICHQIRISAILPRNPRRSVEGPSTQSVRGQRGDGM
jgi:hypothetical protein